MRLQWVDGGREVIIEVVISMCIYDGMELRIQCMIEQDQSIVMSN